MPMGIDAPYEHAVFLDEAEARGGFAGASKGTGVA